MTIQKALSQIKSAVDDALTKEVFEAVREEEAETIEWTVYAAYTPKYYHRREEYGGLGDPDNIEIEGGSARNGRLSVINMAEPNPGGCLNNESVTTNKNLPYVVETAIGYDFPDGWPCKPRPFNANTIKHLRSNKAHVTALKAGLKRQGLKVK